MNRIVIVFHILTLTIIKVGNSQMTDCRKMFISDTNPGIFYEMYPLNLNGVPIGFRKADISTYLSSLSFYMPYIYADNIPGLNFDVSVTEGDTEVVEGEIYGNPITVSNFSFTASAWLRVPKTGWYIFDMKADSGAALFIVNYTTVYCCDNPTNTDFNKQFKITSIPSEPNIEHPSDRVFLYQDFPYELLFAYINLNSSAYLDIHVTDPDGVVHTDITDYASQMNQRNGTEITTCDYVIEQNTTTEYWTGTVTSTLSTSRTYSVASNGTVLVTDVEIIGIPNPDYTLRSSTFSMESEETSSTNHSHVSTNLLEHSSDFSLSTKTRIQNNQSHITSLYTGVGSFTSSLINISSTALAFNSESLGGTFELLSGRTVETGKSTIESNSQSIEFDNSILSSVTYAPSFNISATSQWFPTSQNSSDLSPIIWKSSESPVYKNASSESNSILLETSTILTITSKTYLKLGNTEALDYRSSSKGQVPNSINSLIISLSSKKTEASVNLPTISTNSLDSTASTICKMPLCIRSLIFSATNVITYTSQVESQSTTRTDSELTKSKLQNLESGKEHVSSISDLPKQSFIPVVNPNVAAFTYWDSTCSLVVTLFCTLLFF